VSLAAKENLRYLSLGNKETPLLNIPKVMLEPLNNHKQRSIVFLEPAEANSKKNITSQGLKTKSSGETPPSHNNAPLKSNQKNTDEIIPKTTTISKSEKTTQNSSSLVKTIK
jgi:hypothetical protein